VNSYEIETKMSLLAVDFREAVEAEMKTLDTAQLIRVAFSNPSTWSGSCTISNLAEQVRREICLDELSKGSY
jgi:hypothetical protein